MRYIPNASSDVDAMLETIGVRSIDELFSSVPSEVRVDGLLDLPEPWSEIEIRRWFTQLASKNSGVDRMLSFLGAGAYPHYQPACVDQLLLRAEFLTSYTPYQPEVSQGTLQAIFEYQTHQCMLTGLDVANASLYDGSTAFVEGVLMSERVNRGRNRVVVARTVHPHYRDTLRTYVQNLGVEIVEVGWDSSGRVDMTELRAACNEKTFAVAIQSPNFFGVIEDYDEVAAVADGCGAAKVATIAEASSLGVLSPPGHHGFDIAVGEAQAWGIPLQFGGPYVGFMAVRDAFKRHMPGRLVGETVDVDGRRAFVLTLATREQHIRRGKATSNICTNQALFALAANMYLSLMGKDGLREVAVQCLQKAGYLRTRLLEIPGVSAPFSGPVYNEFVIDTPRPAGEILAALELEGIIGGYEVSNDFDEMPNAVMIAVTEIHMREQLDRFVDAVRAAVGGRA